MDTVALFWSVADLSLPSPDLPVQDVARRDVVVLAQNETIAAALVRLRGVGLGERIIYFYVTDNEGKLVGVVPTRRLLLSDPSAVVGEVMISPVISVLESDSFGDALRILIESRFLALPVIDHQGRLTGILDITRYTQQVLDLERRESAEEIFQIAGVHLEEETHNPLRMARGRFPWLLCNVASGLAAAFVSRAFDGLLSAIVALAFFIPLVLTLAESVAMQSVTMSLAHLSLLRRRLRARSMLREIAVGFLLGGGTGVLVGIVGMVWLGARDVALVVAVGIVVASAIGAIFGVLVPRAVHHWKLDPKIASGPAVLALTDIASLAAYFTLAAAVLQS